MSTLARASIALVLALAVGACGSDEPVTTPDTPTTDPLTPVTTTTVATDTTAEPAPTQPDATTTDATTTVATQPTTTTTTTTTTPASTVEVRIYLVRGERLAIVHRELTGPSILRGALEALLVGPTEAETACGLFSTIPTGTDLLDVDLDEGRATVDLSAEFETGGGTMMMQARIAQIVFTATQFDEVDTVRFWMDGAPIEFLGGEGIVLDEPLTRSDTQRELTHGILFDRPAPDSTVTNPVTITGEGDVFEADFPLFVRRDGERIGDVEIVRAGAWGDWADFSTTVTIDAEPGPVEIVAVDDPGCSPPECAGPVEVVLPLTLTE